MAKKLPTHIIIRTRVHKINTKELVIGLTYIGTCFNVSVVEHWNKNCNLTKLKKKNFNANSIVNPMIILILCTRKKIRETRTNEHGIFF